MNFGRILKYYLNHALSHTRNYSGLKLPINAAIATVTAATGVQVTPTTNGTTPLTPTTPPTSMAQNNRLTMIKNFFKYAGYIAV